MGYARWNGRWGVVGALLLLAMPVCGQIAEKDASRDFGTGGGERTHFSDVWRGHAEKYPFWCTVSVSVEGAGTVRMDPPGGTYMLNDRLTLIAEPAPGHGFEYWNGHELTGEEALIQTITVTGDKDFTARFTHDSVGMVVYNASEIRPAIRTQGTIVWHHLGEELNYAILVGRSDSLMYASVRERYVQAPPTGTPDAAETFWIAAEAPTTINLAGRVTNRYGRPVSGAEVYSPQCDGEVHETGRWGRFECGHIHELPARFFVTAPGYAPGFSDPVTEPNRYFPIRIQQGLSVRGLVVNVADGSAVTQGMVVLQRTLLPAPGVVEVHRLATAPVRADGTYTFAEAAVEGDTVHYLDDTFAGEDPPTTVEARGWQKEVEVNFSVHTGGVVQGRVLKSGTGEGIAGITVTLRPNSDHHAVYHRVQNVQTDANGRYRVGGLADGTYLVQCSDHGRQRYQAPFEPGGPGLWQPTPQCSVRLGEESRAPDLFLDDTVAVSGHVVDANGVPIPTVELFPNGRAQMDLRHFTDEAGGFDIWGFRPGQRFLLVLAKAGWASLTTPVQTMPESGLEDLRLEMQPESRFSGFVHDTAGRPIGNLRVFVISNEGHGGSADTGEGGAFSIRSLAAGTYQVHMAPSSYAYGSRISEPTAFELGVGETVADVELTFPELGETITGSVLQGDGVPVPGFTLQVADRNPQPPLYLAYGSGAYMMAGLEAGVYTLTASTARDTHVPVVKQAVPAGSSGIDFILNRRRIRSGTVFGGNTREPVANFNIGYVPGFHRCWRPWMQEHLERVTSPDGTYSAEWLGEDDVTLVIRAPGYLPWLREDRYKMGKITGIPANLEPACEISGTVVDANGRPIEGAYILESVGFAAPDLREHHNLAMTDKKGAFHVQCNPDRVPCLSILYPDYALGVLLPSREMSDGQSRTVVLERGWNLEGTLRMTGRAVRGATLSVTGMQDRPLQTKADGKYRFEHLPTGQSLLLEATLKDEEGHGSTHCLVVPLRLDEESPVSDLDLPSLDARLEGRIILEGAVLESAQIIAIPVDGAEYPGSHAVSTGLDGHFVLPLPHGTCLVKATATFQQGTMGKRVETTLALASGETIQQDFHLTAR